MGQLGDVHVLGYNSAESELIWMKSGALWVHCWGIGPSRFWARSMQWQEFERQAKFVFLSGK